MKRYFLCITCNKAFKKREIKMITIRRLNRDKKEKKGEKRRKRRKD
jgi:hypothetical protein